MIIKIFTFLMGLFFLTNVFATKVSVDPQFCKIIKDWESHQYTPKELCEKYHGSFCLSVRTDDQAICAASGKPFCTDIKNLGGGICKAGDGVFCDDIKSLGGGFCAALGGSFCYDITPFSEDEVKWHTNLKNICKY